MVAQYEANHLRRSLFRGKLMIYVELLCRPGLWLSVGPLKVRQLVS